MDLIGSLFRRVAVLRQLSLRLPILLGFQLSIVLPILFAPAGAQGRTIEETIAIALSSSPILAEAKARQEALNETIEQAKADGRPSVSTSVGTSYDPFNTVGGVNTGLNATLPIWTGGRVRSSVRAAQFDVDAGEERLRDVEAIVLEAAVTAHADVLFAQEAVEIAAVSIGRLDSQIAEAQLRFELGEATLTDVARLRTQRASVVANLADARAFLTIGEAQYLAIVGQEPRQLAEAGEEPAGLPSSLQQALEIGVEENPLFLEQERIADAAAARVTLARSDRLPRVAVTGGLGRSYIFNDDNADALPFGATLGLEINVPIYAGGLVSSRVREAKAIFRAENFAVETRRREAARDIDIAWAQLQAASARLLASREGLEAAATALEGVRSEYEFGLRTTVDILLAEESFRSAQLAVVRSRSDVLIRQATVLRATGTLSAQSYVR